ncbi:DNA-binding protein [Lactiplantibacillus paraxiangfangensis]|uniref:DNA-binding protein n=1 Tax=Lactiplantibacillus paraxiangfangensis TaxID=3076224 RepID=UPI0030C6A70F
MMASMQMDDQKFIEAVANAVADRVMPELETMVKKYHEPDQGLDQAGAAKVLGCGKDMLNDYYINQPGFPHFMKGSRMVFSRKAIEKWMDENQIYA